MDLREIIRGELVRRGWSQRELCRRTDLYPHQVCDYLSGNKDFLGETLQRIMDVLELEVRRVVRRKNRTK